MWKQIIIFIIHLIAVSYKNSTKKQGKSRKGGNTFKCEYQHSVNLSKK